MAYAATAAARAGAGFSTIGRLISAERTPSRIESHQTTSYEPVRSNAMPPIRTPRKPPTWWLKNEKPTSIESQRVPNITCTRAEVGGTVESQVRPVAAPNTIAEKVVIGNEITP